MVTQQQYLEARGYLETIQQRLWTALNAMNATGRIAIEGDMYYEPSPDEGIQFAYVEYDYKGEELLTEWGATYIGYGTYEGNEHRQIAIGRIVAGYLRDAGLTVEWDGEPTHRLLVKLN